MPRSWTYGKMTGDVTLMSLLPGGVHQSTSEDKAPTLKPFIFYRVIAHRPGVSGDDVNVTRDENFLIFVHDVPGSYVKIDEILLRLKELFVNAKDTAAKVGRVLWLEDSEDFRDDDMGTILKYVRIQVRYRP